MPKLLRPLLCALALGLIAQVAAAQGRVQEMDFRIVLAQLAQKVGANGQITILRAQGADPAPAIVLRGGEMTLGQVAAQSGEALAQGDDGRYVLTRPLLVWADATLRLQPGDALFLKAEAGAFLAALGGLVIDGAQVSSSAPLGATSDLEERFHPFVLVGGQGHMELSDAQLTNLGFGKIPAFSGVALINRGIFPSRAPSTVANSTFEAVRAVSLLSVDDATLQGNDIVSAQDTALVIRAGNRIAVSGTRITAPQGHGVRIAEGAQDIRVSGSEIIAPGGAGIVVDSRSSDISLTENKISTPGSSGILVDGAFCVRAARNSIDSGAFSGIAVQRSARVALAGNTLSHNRSAGIAVTAQPAAATTELTANRLIGNRVGVRGTTSGEIHFAGNDFSDQFPRFLDGDLMFETHRVARDLRGAAAFAFSGAFDPRAVVVPDCTTPGDA